MATENFRVENKQNVNMNGRRTAFKLYRRSGEAFVFQGEYTASGWDRTDAQCVTAALDTLDRLENESPQA